VACTFGTFKGGKHTHVIEGKEYAGARGQEVHMDQHWVTLDFRQRATKATHLFTDVGIRPMLTRGLCAPDAFESCAIKTHHKYTI